MRRRVQLSVRLLLSLSLVILLVSMLAPAQAPVAAQDANLLQNPGFEGQYIAVGGDTAVLVAPSWQPWHLPPPPGAPTSVNLQPDYQPARADRVRSGQSAQQYDTFFATHIGGVYQRVPVEAGANLTFSVFIYPYSSASFEDIDQSIDPQGLFVSVGIDPNGGTSGDSNSIIWSTPAEYYDEYRQISVSTTVPGTSITVFVRSSVENATGLHQVFLDDAALITTGTEPIPPTATPTTSGPTNTPAPPTATVPTATPGPQQPTATQTPLPATTEAAATPVRTPYSDEFPNELAYTVQFGDTVIDLAVRFSSSVDAIIDYNGLSSSGLIFVNQALLIPVPAGQGTPVVVTPPPSAPPDFGQGGALPLGSTYVVQPGDNLFRIALRANLSADALAQYNGILNPDRIFVGQTIRIPPAPSLPVPAQPVPAQPIGSRPPVTSGHYVIHVVQPGENVFRIGLRYNVTVDVIARANHLFNPNLIFVGQQLIIPQ